MEKIPDNINILAVVPEKHSGPGWTNQTISIIYQENFGSNEIKRIYLQPDDWQMHAGLSYLFEVGATISDELLIEAKKFISSTRLP